MMDVKAQVDEVWHSLGTWGRYQVLQITYIYVGMVIFAFTVLGIVFIGYTPPHECKQLSKPLSFYINNSIIDDNSSNFEIDYAQCHIDIRINTTNRTDFTYQFPCLEGYQYKTQDITIVTEWDLVCGNAGLGELTQTLGILGQLVGALVFPSLSDRYGRKPIFVINIFIIFVLSLALTFAPYYFLFAVLRILVGMFLEGFGLASFILILETFPQECRGRIGAIGALGWSFCVVLLTPFGYFLRNYTWRYLQLVIALISAYGLCGYWVIDESLRWLVANNKNKEAIRVVKKAARRNNVDAEQPLKILFGRSKSLQVPLLQDSWQDDGHGKPNCKHFGDELNKSDITAEIDPSNVEHYNLLTIIKHKVILKMSLIVWFTWLTNSVTYYGLTLTSSTLAGNRFLNYFLTSFVEVPGAICFLFLIDRIGRKRTSIIFHALTGISLILSVVMLVIKGDDSTTTIVSSVFNLIGKFGISSTFNVIFLQTPELYPTNLRNAGIGMASSAAKFGGMVAPYSSLLAAQAVWAPGVIFGSLCLLVTVLTTLLPETKGLELPQFIGELTLWYKEQSQNFKKRKPHSKKTSNDQQDGFSQ